MTNPLVSDPTAVAAMVITLSRPQSDRLRFDCVCALPGVELVHETFLASVKDWDEATALASDAHNSWRTWGACFDEVMFSLVPQGSLF